MNVNITSKRNWAYIFSPCVFLAIFFAAIAVLYMVTPGEHGEHGAYIAYAILLMLPCLIISLLIDFIIRFCLKKVKKKALYIWGIEAIVIAFVFGLFRFWYTL